MGSFAWANDTLSNGINPFFPRTQIWDVYNFGNLITSSLLFVVEGSGKLRFAENLSLSNAEMENLTRNPQIGH